MADFLSFALSEDFIEPYKTKQPNWGFDIGGGNSLAELTFITKYSRLKEDGTKERWWEVCQRCIEGYYSILKDHCIEGKTPWNEWKAQKSARDAYDRMFAFKWMPPGRGLWMMGTEFTNGRGNSAALQNCAMISTEKLSAHSVQEATLPFVRLMEMSMLGVGVGFDTKGAGKLTFQTPSDEVDCWVIPDTREGWCESVQMKLESFLFKNRNAITFDYSEIRPAGERIKGFGGVAAGPQPLADLHDKLDELFSNRGGTLMGSVDIVDICNLIAKCVVSGNVRRCLPADTIVHTARGGIRIEDIEVGDEAVMADGRFRVSAKFDQGTQRTVRVAHQFGTLECTPNHRVQVFDGLFGRTWKQAGDLTEDDLLVWDATGYDGVETTLPDRDPYTRNARDTRSIDWSVPVLDEGIAWLVGQIHGDGYVFTPSETAKTPNGHVSVAVAPGCYDQAEYLVEQFAKFGLNALIREYHHDKAIRVNVHSSSFAKYFLGIKIPNSEIRVPDFIRNGLPSVRAAYLAGVFDADGCYGKPIHAVSTVYEQFAEDIREVFASLGIAARPEVLREAVGNWQRLFGVSILGTENINRTDDWFSELSFKWDGPKHRPTGGFRFSTQDAKTALGGRTWLTNSKITTATLARQEGVKFNQFPVEVLSVTEGCDRRTFDIEVEDVHQFVAEGLVVHNSALIALGEDDDVDFMNLKNAEAFPERNDFGTGWAWSSNNSVLASLDEDNSKYVQRITENGEPGLVFLDLIRSHGRLCDPPDNKDARVIGVNPCVTGDTWVMTAEGPRQALDLVGNPIPMVVDGKEYPVESNGFFPTGTKPVWKLVTEEGWSARLTENHQVLLDSGQWVEAGELNPGDKIRRHMHVGNEWDGDGTFEEGYVSGLYVGDGSRISGEPTLCTWGDTPGVESVRSFIYDYVDSLRHRSDWLGWRPVAGRGEMRLQSAALRNVLARYGFGVDVTKTIDESLLTSSSAMQKGFISGMFDADGHVEGESNGGGISIRLAQSDRGMLETIQRMLGSFGISSKIRLGQPAGLSELPDGKGGTALYKTKTAWRLIITGADCALFMTEIGFKDTDKRDKYYAAEAKMTRGFYSKAPVATFVALEFDGTEQVYDVTVEDVHAFDANGLYVHNCAEQGLESFEVCTLVETFPHHHDSVEDFKQTLKHAYLYGKAVTLLPTHWPETNAIMQRNRRIGCSVSGLAQFVESRSWTELRTWLNESFEFVHQRDVQYSEWLGVRESIKWTTVKPSGTVSLVAGSTPGVHWPVASREYWRRIRFSNVDPMLEVIRDAGYLVEPDVVNSKTTSVATFPTHGPQMRNEQEVSVWEKAELAALCQRWWSNNMVSCTLTFSEDEKDQLPALVSAKTGQLKTMSMLPLDVQAYAQLPYEAIDGEVDWGKAKKIDWDLIYDKIGVEAEGERFCTTDHCEIPA